MRGAQASPKESQFLVDARAYSPNASPLQVYSTYLESAVCLYSSLASKIKTAKTQRRRRRYAGDTRRWRSNSLGHDRPCSISVILFIVVSAIFLSAFFVKNA